MNKPIIEVNNISKKYRIGVKQPYYSLRDSIVGVVKSPLQFFKHSPIGKNGLAEDEFWALKDLSFNVQPGEAVGIIGRNGAGKSTLLKVLSQITPPTKGSIVLRGRVASLLEVGTGFHPELTGRENIFLNGAILGMKRWEIKKKFDEIVDFAGMEKFLDTPVKHYSSGMYMRLAFSVAAHLEPEILIVDEVLSVGDAEFQKKCLGKMRNVGKEGRTVLFVSHNMLAVNNLCQRAILIDKGSITDDGNVNKVSEKYLKLAQKQMEKANIQEQINKVPQNAVFKLENLTIMQHGTHQSLLDNTKDIEIEFRYRVFEEKLRLFVNFELWNAEGVCLIESFHNGSSANPVMEKGRYISRAVIPANFLIGGAYEMKIFAGIFGDYDFINPPLSFMLEIVDNNPHNTAYLVRPLCGKIFLPVKWETKELG